MVLELESLSASLKVALELPELRTIGVVGQVPLELRQVRVVPAQVQLLLQPDQPSESSRRAR